MARASNPDPASRADGSHAPLVSGHDLWSLAYLYSVRWMSQLLPPKTVVRGGHWFGEAYAKARAQRAGRVARHMRSAFEGTALPGDPEAMAREFLALELRKSVDDLVMHRLDFAELRCRTRVIGIEHLDEALGAGRGAFLTSGHFHANRLAKFYLRRTGYPVMSIRNHSPVSAANGLLGRRFVAARFARFLSTVVEDDVDLNDRAVGARVMQRLRQGGVVDVHLDAGTSAQRVELPFLNEPRRFATGFLRIAEQLGVPLVPMCCVGNSDGLEIRFQASVRFEGRSEPEQSTERLVQLVRRVEDDVRKHPTEWELWARRKPLRRPAAGSSVHSG